MALFEDNLLEIVGLEEVSTLGDFLRISERFKRIHELFSMTVIDGEEAPPALFYLEGDPVCRLIEAELTAGVLHPEVPLPYDHSSIDTVRTGTALVFRAMKTGYLGWHNGLRIYPPLLKTSDYSVVFRKLPLASGDEMLASFLAKKCRSHRQRYLHPDISVFSPEQAELLVKGETGDTVIIKGIEPQAGREAQITVRVEPQSPDKNRMGSIDYREFHHYIIAARDQVLVEKKEPFAGIDGVSVTGDLIPVTAGRDLPFAAGENISIEQEGDLTLFKAAIDGLVHISDTSVSVSEVMLVKKDVDLSTGNIVYEKDVVVKGSVRSGFSLHAKGDVVVHGTVEPGVEIDCGGNLTIFGGVLGSSTYLRIKGSAEIGFVQDSRVYCSGTLYIEKHALNAHLFAGEHLHVDGKGIKDRGQAVQGGSCTAMGEIHLHSIGSALVDTEITSGYNAYAEASMKNIEEALAALDVHISKLMERIGIDTDIQKYREKLRDMRPDQREKLKKALIELKSFTLKREALEKEKEERRKSIYQSDPSLLRIHVKNRLVPRVIVHMLEENHTFTGTRSSLNLRLFEGHIVEQ